MADGGVLYAACTTTRQIGCRANTFKVLVLPKITTNNLLARQLCGVVVMHDECCDVCPCCYKAYSTDPAGCNTAASE